MTTKLETQIGKPEEVANWVYEDNVTQHLYFQEWVDPMLRWGPAEYGGIQMLRIPHSEVWKPDILLYNR